MKTNNTNEFLLRNLTKWTFIAMMICLLFTACKKDNAITPDPVAPVVATDTMFNRLITVKNFGAVLDSGSVADDEQSPIFYSLETNSATPVAYKQTDRWDLSFSGVYRSFISANNKIAGNLGQGGPGVGGILILAQNFDSVTDVPSDDQFKANGAVGTDDAGNFGTGVGYYIYDFGGTIKGDGSFEKQHVAYVLQDTRTILVRTAKGNYAKIQMLSIYKDLLDPTTWTRDSPAPYFSFKYILVKAGSKTFTVNK